MGFPLSVREDALVLCGRHCCLCHKFCGIKIEIHHIKQSSEGGADTLENAIALCFDCHADMRSYDHKHPKGAKYSPNELTRHRDSWHEKVRSSPARAPDQATLQSDARVLQHLTNILPWDGSIGFIRSNNFAGFSFNCDNLQQLDTFVAACENPAFEFIDSDLDGLRATLLSHILDFNRAIGQYTFRVGTGSHNSVPSDWEIEQPEFFDSVVKKIHNAASSATEAYDSLIKTARRKLGVVSLA